jgi:hypothetical protein
MNTAESRDLTSSAIGPTYLRGGRYMVGCVGANFGTVALQGLMNDGSTFTTLNDVAGNAVSFAAVGWKLVDIAPGQYKIAIVSATGVTVRATSVPT